MKKQLQEIENDLAKTKRVVDDLKLETVDKISKAINIVSGNYAKKIEDIEIKIEKLNKNNNDHAERQISLLEGLLGTSLSTNKEIVKLCKRVNNIETKTKDYEEIKEVTEDFKKINFFYKHGWKIFSGALGLFLLFNDIIISFRNDVVEMIKGSG